MSEKKPKKVKFVPGEKFVLTERSHRDALRLDDEAPQKVFVPYNEASGSKGSTSQAQKSYQRFLGIEFDDDTDYLKYMKANPDGPVDDEDGFMTKDEIYDGYLGQDLQLGAIDPEVAFQLEDDYDGEKEYAYVAKLESGKLRDEEGQIGTDDEDDLLNQLMEEGDSESDHETSDITAKMGYTMQKFLDAETTPHSTSILKRHVQKPIPEGAEIDDFSDGTDNFEERQFDTKSKFTEYSMSSSVMRRSEHLTVIDDTFDHFFDEFDDPEMGDLENQADEITNVHDTLNEAATYRLLKIHDKQLNENMPIYAQDLDPESAQQAKICKEKALELLEKMDSTDEDEDPGMEIRRQMEVGRAPKPQFDCESILSTKSNIYNRPKFVDESKMLLRNKNKIRLNKMGLPMGPGPSFKQLKKQEAQRKKDENSNDIDSDGAGSMDGMSQMTSLTVLLSEASVRNKTETPQERKQRKMMVRELRRARREERKNTRQAFREEGIKQAKSEINRQRDKAIRL